MSAHSDGRVWCPLYQIWAIIHYQQMVQGLTRAFSNGDLMEHFPPYTNNRNRFTLQNGGSKRTKDKGWKMFTVTQWSETPTLRCWVTHESPMDIRKQDTSNRFNLPCKIQPTLTGHETSVPHNSQEPDLLKCTDASLPHRSRHDTIRETEPF